jgi:transcriptional regulator with XRE-family HTH domain
MQRKIIERLSHEYTRARAKNPAYSLRAFANRLGVQVSALSEILNGKREITQKMGDRILTGLGLSPFEKKSILSGESISKDANLSLDYFKIVSEWYYFAILSLAEIPDFKADHLWISKRLNISKKEAKIALDKLVKLEMLVVNDDGSCEVPNIQYKTPTDVLNISLKNHTLQSLELAMNSILHDPVDVRDFSTVTMAIDPKKIKEAKNMIMSFRKKLSKKLENGKKKEVYKLAIQLFPLSRQRFPLNDQIGEEKKND